MWDWFWYMHVEFFWRMAGLCVNLCKVKSINMWWPREETDMRTSKSAIILASFWASDRLLLCTSRITIVPATCECSSTRLKPLQYVVSANSSIFVGAIVSTLSKRAEKSATRPTNLKALAVHHHYSYSMFQYCLHNLMSRWSLLSLKNSC